jgi:Protein of unknown function (DUF3592)
MAGEISTNPAWRARRRRRMLLPLLIGVTLLALAGWAYATQTATTRRAVTTTAVIQEVHQGPFHDDAQTGSRTFEMLGTVRYQVDGANVRATVTLVRTCDGSTLCVRRYQPGDQVAVAYDPDHTSDAALAIDRHGRYPVPGKGVLLLGLLAGLFLAAATVIFVLGPEPPRPHRR